MHTQHPAPHQRTLLTISICAALTACAPIPVDDERVQKSAYQRLSTYVSSGPNREAPKAKTRSETASETAALAANTPSTTVPPTPTTALPSIPVTSPTIKPTPTPIPEAPIALGNNPATPTTSVVSSDSNLETPEKSKSLFGFVSNLFGKEKDGDAASNANDVRSKNNGLATAPAATVASQPNTAGFANLYGTSAYETPSLQRTDAAPPPVASTTATETTAPETERKSIFGGLFSSVKNALGKSQDTATSTTEAAANIPSPAPLAAPITANTYTQHNAQQNAPAAQAALPKDVPDQAFSAANPIYITALDLSINNLSKRLKTSNFALDERGLAFLTKGALDEDTTYKFLTETQLAAHREKALNAQNAQSSRSLFDAMKDFMPRRKKEDLPSKLPKTMTLLNTVVVMQSASEEGAQQAIIMMKLKDNQTGIHLTDARRTIQLSKTQAQSSLAIKRAIGAELPGMLERLAKNAFASLTAPERSSNQQSERYVPRGAERDSVSHYAPSKGQPVSRSRDDAPRTRVVDLSSEALAARDATDARYANSVIIGKNGESKAPKAKLIDTSPNAYPEGNVVDTDNVAPIYRITAEEILAAERAAANELVAEQIAAASAERKAEAQANAQKLAQQQRPRTEQPRERQAQAMAQPALEGLASNIAPNPAARMDRVLAVRTNPQSQTPSTSASLSQNPSQNSQGDAGAKTVSTKKPETKEFFGIQLMRASELSYLKDALRKLSIDPSKVNIIRQQATDNRIRYVAIYGQFNSQSEAQQTLNQLPEDVLSEGAFVRRVAVKARKTS